MRSRYLVLLVAVLLAGCVGTSRSRSPKPGSNYVNNSGEWIEIGMDGKAHHAAMPLDSGTDRDDDPVKASRDRCPGCGEDFASLRCAAQARTKSQKLHLEDASLSACQPIQSRESIQFHARIRIETGGGARKCDTVTSSFRYQACWSAVSTAPSSVSSRARRTSTTPPRARKWKPARSPALLRCRSDNQRRRR